MEQIRLESTGGTDLVAFREITGVEEQAVAGTSTRDAIVLLDALVVSCSDGAVQDKGVGCLVSWDRERLLAAVYMRTYGNRVESTLKCGQCAEKFEMDFQLDALLKFLRPADPATLGVTCLENGAFISGEGIAFRLPTGDDECLVAGLDPEDARSVLLGRCIQNESEAPGFEQQMDSIQSTMESLSPLVDIELDARCPECGHEQVAHFDLQYYLLSSIRGERRRLMEEIHALASNYGWSLSEILSLPRSQRRMLAELVEADEGVGL